MLVSLEKSLDKTRNPLLINTKIVISTFLFLTFFFSALAHAQRVDDLWIYVQNDRADQVGALLKQGLDPNTTTDIGNPILMQAVRDNSWAVFDVVMKNPKTNLKIMNGYQETPLMYVSLVGDLPRVKALVARGAEINHLGWTPLHYAATKGQTALVEYLLSQGAMPNAPSPNGSSPIMMAARSGSPDTVQVLLDAGADPVAIDMNGDNAATVARDNGHSGLADSLQEIIDKRQAK